ncbi:hypothetical protein RIF29_10347 [Crotalaria pallida]|uniref:Uncharacterized protein n=1 Tax=Crotalaria pallida TaxID=3830 RepID=A0AAN9FSN1_CROPI
MAKKRGRPPKSPSPHLTKHDVTDQQVAQRFDLTSLDQEDLEVIDNLSAKQLESLMQGLELIKARVRGKGAAENIDEAGIRTYKGEGSGNPKSPVVEIDGNKEEVHEERSLDEGSIPVENRNVAAKAIKQVMSDPNILSQPVQQVIVGAEDAMSNREVQKDIVNASPTESMVPQTTEEISEEEWTPEGVSYHSPAIVTWGARHWERAGTFKFFNMLVKDAYFIKIVQDAWLTDHSGSAMYVLMRKLRSVQKPIKDLNAAKYHQIDRKEEVCREMLLNAQANLATDPLNIHLQKVEKEAYQNYLAVSKAAICFLKQKAKEFWLKEGDQNTRAFHQAIKQRRYKNRILTIKNDQGQVATDQTGIGEAFKVLC